MADQDIPSSDELKARIIRAKLAPPTDTGAGPEKTYYNELNQPFTLSGKAPPATALPDQGYTGTVLPLRRDESGLHLAVPEAMASPVRGAVSAGKRALGVGEQGQNPLRQFTPDELAATMAASPTTAAISKGATTLPAATGITQERALLAREAMDTFGIPLTVPQVGGSPMMKLVDAAIRNLPLSGAREHEIKIRESFNRAVSKTFGEDSDLITQSVMDGAKKRIGGEINRIEDKTEVGFDQDLLNDLASIETNARAGLTDEEYGVVKRLLDGTIQNVTPAGKIAGTTYGNLLHRKSPIDQAASNANSNIARPAQQIKTALQNALQRSLSGSDLDDYRLARFQYKNMQTVKPLVNKAPTGDISPTLLNAEVSKNFPNRAFDASSGANPLDRLAKIGQAFLREPPSSGTAERGYTLARLAELGGAVAAGDVFGIPATLGGVGATLGAGRVAGSIMRRPGLAKRAVEKTLNPIPRWPGVSGPGLLYRSFPGGVVGDQSQPTLNDVLNK